MYTRYLGQCNVSSISFGMSCSSVRNKDFHCICTDSHCKPYNYMLHTLYDASILVSREDNAIIRCQSHTCNRELMSPQLSDTVWVWRAELKIENKI